MQRILLLIAFTLSLSSIVPAQQLITYGEQIDSVIHQPGERHLFRFEGKQGDVIALRMRDRESPVDACFELYDPALNLISRKCGDGGIMELFGKTLKADGIYTLYVQDNHDNDKGTYGLSLHQMNLPPYASSLTEGDDLVDRIGSGVQMNAYTFQAVEGEAIRFQMRAEDLHFESTMIIVDQNGLQLEKSYRKSNVYAGIDRWIAPADGTYSLFIFDSGGNDTSAYGMSYQSLSNPQHTVPLTCKEVRESSIHQLAEIHAYSLHLTAGETGFLVAKAESNYLESSIHVINAEGIEEKHLSGSGKAIFTQFTNNGPDQDFLITFEDDRGNDLSPYFITVLTFSKGCAHEISCGEGLDEINPVGVPNLYYFPVTAGQQYTFGVKEKQTAIEPWGILFDQYGNELENVNDPVKFSISHQAADNGFWWVLVMDRGANDVGSYSYSLEGCAAQLPDFEVSCSSVSLRLNEDGMGFLLPEDIDQTEYPEGLEISRTVSPASFSCQDLGEQEVVLTVTDQFGRSQSCTTKVEIISPIELTLPGCPIVFSDYSPAACTVLEAGADKGTGPYSYQWSNGDQNFAIQVCPDKSINYGIKVTDANGCTAYGQIYVQAVEIACDNKGKKINICHRPSNDPSKENTLCVSINAVNGHLSHGPGHEEDHLGECGDDYCHEDALKLESRSGSAATVTEMLVQTQSDQVEQAFLFNQLGQVILRFQSNQEVLQWVSEKESYAQGIYYLRWADLKGNWFITRVLR
ncbi:MAG: hypothetical protein R2806_24595 [Saprospiraceae bacterium]